MPIITAYQCPRTAKVFVDKSDYMIHLKAMATYNNQNRKEAKVNRNIHYLLHKMRQVFSLKDLETWIVENSFIFFVNAKKNGAFYGKYPERRCKFGKIKSVEFIIKKYSETIPNSHQAPIGGISNWNEDINNPIGYPGWQGRIKINIDGPHGFMSDLFRNTGVNIGTGGGNEFEVFLFQQDWPGLANTAMLAKLAGGKSTDIIFPIDV